MNIKAQKNYGLGIRMINWPNGKNFYYHNGWWHGNMVLRYEEEVTIALSNKYDKRVYKVRKLSALFGIILFN
jgi:hypothetical protein